jgi:hypothetical protein
MNQPEILDSDIRALQRWLRAAWQQLGDPSLTNFSRRELRNQMCSAPRGAADGRATNEPPSNRPRLSRPELHPT